MRRDDRFQRSTVADLREELTSQRQPHLGLKRVIVEGHSSGDAVVRRFIVQPVLRKGSAELRGVSCHIAEQVVSAVRHLHVLVALCDLHALSEVSPNVLVEVALAVLQTDTCGLVVPDGGLLADRDLAAGAVPLRVQDNSSQKRLFFCRLDSRNLRLQLDGCGVLKKVQGVGMDGSPAVVLLALWLALAVLKLKSGTKVDDRVGALLALDRRVCPKQVVPPALVVLARKEPAVHLLQHVGHVERLGAGKVQSAAPGQRHLVENPLVVRKRPLVGRTCSEQRRRPSLPLHVDQGLMSDAPVLLGRWASL